MQRTVARVRLRRALRYIIAAFGCFAVAQAASACGGGGDRTSAGTSSTAASSKPGRGTKVGVLMLSLENPYLKLVKKGIDEGIDETGARMVFKAPAKATDVADQVSGLEDILAQDPDVLVTFSVSVDQLKPVLGTARDVPLIAIEGDFAGVPQKKTLIGTDGYTAAKRGGEFVAKQAPALGIKTIGILTGTPGVPNHQERLKGFLDGIADSQVKPVSQLRTDCDSAKGVTATENLLTAHPDVDAIFAICDQPIVAAIKAVRKAGRKPADMFLMGYDASDEALAAIRRGDMKADIAQAPEKEGRVAIEQAVAAAQHKPVPARIDTGSAIVTKDNLTKFEARE
jgi:ABC-type sugar transport system substrate-binding protein